MAFCIKLISALLLAAVLVKEIQSRPEPGVHHYRYKISGPDTETVISGNGGNGGQTVVSGHGGNGGETIITTSSEDRTNYGARSTDTRQRGQGCHRGLIDQAVAGAQNALSGAGDALSSAVGGNRGGGLLNVLGRGVNHVWKNAVHGAGHFITDAACGLGNMANEAASGLNNGNIIGGVANMAHEFVGGLANMGTDVLSAAGNAAKGVASDAKQLG